MACVMEVLQEKKLTWQMAECFGQDRFIIQNTSISNHKEFTLSYGPIELFQIWNYQSLWRFSFSIFGKILNFTKKKTAKLFEIPNQLFLKNPDILHEK